MFPAFLLPLLLINTNQQPFEPPKYDKDEFRLHMLDFALKDNIYLASLLNKK